MNATSLLVSTTRLVLQAEANGTADLANMSDLFRLVPYLRQSLSCTVCGSLLIEPYTPQATQCQHHVCRSCLGGRKSLKPTCQSCRDYQKYEVNTQLRILLQCYKTLCEYIVSKPIYSFVVSAGAAGQQPTAASNGNSTSSLASNSLVELIEEGARFKDNYKSNSGQLKNTYSMLPCVYNTLPVPITSNAPASSSYSSESASPATQFLSPAATVVAPQMIHSVRPSALATATSSTSSSSSFLTTQSSYSTMVDIKPDVKTLNLLRTTSQPMLHVQPQPPSHIQLPNPQQQHIMQQQPLQYHSNINPTPPPQSIQVQQPNKQKMWMTTVTNNKQPIRSQMIPVQTNAIYQTPTQVQTKPQKQQTTLPYTVPTMAPMKPVPNGSPSPMYSVMYAGTGNKITIKRKTDHVDTSSDYSTIRVNPTKPSASKSSPFMITSNPAANLYNDHKLPTLVQTHQLPIPSSTTIRPHSVQVVNPHHHQVQQHQHLQSFSSSSLVQSSKPFGIQPPPQFSAHHMVQQNFKKPVAARAKSIAATAASAAAKRKGCRCGNATPTPGKLTCCGQRCPCYVDAKSCVDCKCRGCRNPHRADGLKIRPHIPELNTIELIDTTNLDTTSSPLANQVEMHLDRFGAASNSSGSSSSSGGHHGIALTTTSGGGFTTIPHAAAGSLFGAAGAAISTALTANRLDGIDAATLQSLDQDSIVFNPDDVEDTNFEVVNVLASQMPSMSYATLPTFLVHDTTPSTSYFSTTATAATLSATPQTNLLATDDDDEEDEANDLISTTLRAAPALVQKYQYQPTTMVYESTKAMQTQPVLFPPRSDVHSVSDDDEEEDEDDEDDDEDNDDGDEELVTSDDVSDDGDVDV